MARAETETGESQTGDMEHDLAEQARHETEYLATEAREEMQRLTGEARREARRLRQRGIELVRDQKGSAATQISRVADAIHETAGHLNENNQGQMARYADWVANGLNRLSHTLRDRDVDDLADRVSDYARRQPAMFLGGAMAAGFLLSRFLKSSEEAETVTGEHPETTPRVYGSPISGGAPDIERGEVR